MLDGCGTFYKMLKFDCGKTVLVEYLKPGIDVFDRDNVGLLLLLQPKHFRVGSDRPQLCVANTHLLFNPRRGDVQLAQLMMLFAEIDLLATYDIASTMPWNPSYHSVVICGDFNVVPFSGLYDFIRRGCVSCDNQLSFR